ncbi:MAG: SGNH/GDSL hydrolase family protein [Armatimonadota bacterium]
MKTKCIMILALLALTSLCACSEESASVNFDLGPSQEMIAKSLVSMGDTARLERVMAKARRGEKIVVVTIGGSITQAAAASAPEKRWANLVAKWWIDKFPNTKVDFINAGIGATASDIGCHRVCDHVLKYKPDFVVTEYAVNDTGSDMAGETMEGIVRQVLKQPNSPAMMLLFTMHWDGQNAQAQHALVGKCYGLPMVSFRNAVWPEFQAGHIKWQDVMPDTIHPNDWGHRCLAAFVTSVLDKVYASLPDDKKLPRIKSLPKPLISDRFEWTSMLNASNTKPCVNNGWAVTDVNMFAQGWETSVPRSTIEFDVEGNTISLMYYRADGDMGIAQAQVDDLPPVSIDASFPGGWGGYSAWKLIAQNLAPGMHKLRITVTPDKAPTSNGHKFQLQAVMVAGRQH